MRAIALITDSCDHTFPQKNQMFETLRHDIARNGHDGRWCTNTGFWILAVYRFGMWAHTLPFLFRIPAWTLYRLLRLPYIFYHVHLWAGANGTKIGPGLRLIHPTNVMIGHGVEIGKDVIIFHDVTLGTGQVPGVPKIGDHVDIYPGARVLGGIVIGDHSMIGANCVVTRDVPADSIVLTTASRVIPRSLSPVARGADQKSAESASQPPQP